MIDKKPGVELDRYFANLIGYQSFTTALNRDGTYGYIPAYSTTWDGLSMVIGEMERRGYGVAIQIGRSRYQVDGYVLWRLNSTDVQRRWRYSSSCSLKSSNKGYTRGR